MELKLSKKTVEELMKLSPVAKLDAADWLRQEAQKQQMDDPGEGSTVAEATLALEALRGLDKESRDMVISFVLNEDSRAKR